MQTISTWMTHAVDGLHVTDILFREYCVLAGAGLGLVYTSIGYLFAKFASLRGYWLGKCVVHSKLPEAANIPLEYDIFYQITPVFWKWIQLRTWYRVKDEEMEPIPDVGFGRRKNVDYLHFSFHKAKRRMSGFGSSVLRYSAKGPTLKGFAVGFAETDKAPSLIYTVYVELIPTKSVPPWVAPVLLKRRR